MTVTFLPLIFSIFFTVTVLNTRSVSFFPTVTFLPSFTSATRTVTVFVFAEHADSVRAGSVVVVAIEPAAGTEAIATDGTATDRDNAVVDTTAGVDASITDTATVKSPDAVGVPVI